MLTVSIFPFFNLCASAQQDPSNLQGKVQKHQAFEAELSANQSRIDALQKSGQELLDGKHYASSEVASRMEEVSSQWKKLLEATELKGTGCRKAWVDQFTELKIM